MLAEMLLEEGKPVEALAEAEEVLKVAPRRYNALWTAARAAELADIDQVAAAHYNELLEVVKHDAARTELAVGKVVRCEEVRCSGHEE